MYPAVGVVNGIRIKAGVLCCMPPRHVFGLGVCGTTADTRLSEAAPELRHHTRAAAGGPCAWHLYNKACDAVRPPPRAPGGGVRQGTAVTPLYFCQPPCPAMCLCRRVKWPCRPRNPCNAAIIGRPRSCPTFVNGLFVRNESMLLSAL